MYNPDHIFFGLSRFKHMQIRVNAEPAAFYRLVAFISLCPHKDPPSLGHP